MLNLLNSSWHVVIPNHAVYFKDYPFYDSYDPHGNETRLKDFDQFFNDGYRLVIALLLEVEIGNSNDFGDGKSLRGEVFQLRKEYIENLLTINSLPTNRSLVFILKWKCN